MHRIPAFTCIAIGLVFVSSAAWCSSDEAVTEYGDSAAFNGQEIRAFFTHKGPEIVALGVEVPAAAYDDAPMDPPSDGKYDTPVDADDPSKGVAWYCCGYEIPVSLPESAQQMTAFRNAVLNWNPQGHPPPGVYNARHTDFHFYFMSEQERLSIGHAADAKSMCWLPNPMGSEPPKIPDPQSCEQLAVTAAPLPADQVPPGYQSLGATEAAMGDHLVSLGWHEFHGQPFTEALIFTANAGHLTGMEPMVALDYMQSLQEPQRTAITMPAAFPTAGMYPTEYVVAYDRDAGLFRVSFENWKAFPASTGEAPAAEAAATSSP